MSTKCQPVAVVVDIFQSHRVVDRQTDIVVIRGDPTSYICFVVKNLSIVAVFNKVFFSIISYCFLY